MNISIMSNSPYWLEIAQKLQALAQAGLTYSQNEFDIDRYKQLRTLAVDIVSDHTEIKEPVIRSMFTIEKGYPTPKIDVRAVIFRAGKILLVKEKMDGNWSLPGGWADIGLSPFETAKKEVFEESGLLVIPIRLLAVLDKKKHNHPPDIYHAYKLFILCYEKGGSLKSGMETLDAAFFELNEIPELSIERNTPEQISLMFDFYKNPERATICD
jgi:ADP-ribose pyrophosphatase YjhB (NUDIX family)